MAALRRPSTENGDSHFSRLEASFSHTKVAPRQNSIEMKDVSRHTQAGDLDVNELDFNFSLDRSHYPLDTLSSLQDVFSAVQHDTHFANRRNFSEVTQIKCFEADGNNTAWHLLDSHQLSGLLQNATNSANPPQASVAPAGLGPSPGNKLSQSRKQKLLAFFVPLVPATNTSFGSRIAMTRNNTMELFTTLRVNPLFLMNLLGRPDYWAPQTRWESDSNSDFLACDFFCQHPRWNLQFQGAPLSVYMRYSVPMNLTTYIISHKEGDTNVKALYSILDIAVNTARPDKKSNIFLDDPFDLAVILSTLGFESSKLHVSRFRRYMWSRVNKVDDHLAGLETNDRRKLSELTKEMQVISQNADSHLANADVAIITAIAIRTAHSRLHSAISSPAAAYERAADSIDYVIESVQKQKLWFLNYKNRKDSTMALVYNLVTQQDASSNIQLASSMKRDSTSMNAIAAMTMIFLPGTFTAAVFDAGIFSTAANNKGIRVSGLWWFWLAITIPLTLAVIVSWWLYKRKYQRKVQPAPERVAEDDGIAPKPRIFHLNGLFSRSLHDNVASKA